MPDGFGLCTMKTSSSKILVKVNSYEFFFEVDQC